MPNPASIPALPQRFSGGHELYDFIMGTIEQELTSAQIPGLQEKYKDETPEQRQERAKRYEAAFAAYKDRFAEYNAYWNKQFSDHKRATIASLEAEHRAGESHTLDALDFSISRQ